MNRFKLTAEFISNHIKSTGYIAGSIITTEGYAAQGDKGGARWKATGNIIAVSQDVIATNNIRISDASGNEFELVGEGVIDLNALGGTSIPYATIATAAGLVYVQGLSLGTGGTITEATTTATGGQTVFTTPAAYVIGNNSLSVFVNGLKKYLSNGDYTETTTTSFTLTTPSILNDKVQAVVQQTSILSTAAESVIAVSTLTDLVNRPATQVGETFEVIERTTGNRGGGIWRAVLTSGVTPNTFNIVVGVSNPTISFVLELTDPLKWRTFGVVPGGIIDTTAAAQAAINTGFNIEMEEGVYRLTNELLIITAGQELFGNGGGYVDNDTDGLVGAKTVLFVDRTDTIPPYRKTRRQAPETALDPNDDPMSVVVNNQGEDAKFRDFAIQLDCDYTNLSPTNLGGDADVGFMNGCRSNVEISNVVCYGYFRVAGFYLDVTRGTTTAEFTQPSGPTYPSDGTNGSDRVHLSACRSRGGLKGVFVAGAKVSPSGNYYDVVTAMILTDNGGRGGSGASDLLIDQNSYFESREHHSGQRATDPTMNTATEDVDTMAAPIAIDGRRASSTQPRTRRINITNTRLRTIEGARLFTDRVYELNINWMHTEPKSGTVTSTGGTVVNAADYDFQDDTGTAQAGTATTITLATTASAVDDTYNGKTVVLTVGPSSGQSRVISDYVGATRVATVDTAWTTNPTASSVYEVNGSSYGPIACVETDDISIPPVGTDQVAIYGMWGTGIQEPWSDDLVETFTQQRDYIDNKPWIPVFQFVTQPTYTSQSGTATIVGNKVFCTFSMTFSGLDTADISPITLTGLPENISGLGALTGEISLKSSSSLIPATGTFRLIEATSNFNFKLVNEAGVDYTYNGGQISAAGSLVGSFWYRT